MTIYLDQNADALTNITCLNTFKWIDPTTPESNLTIPARQMTTARLMRLLNSNNFRLKKMCALSIATTSIALAILLGVLAIPITAKALAICAIVSLIYFIKIRIDQKKWVADVTIEIAAVQQIIRGMTAYFVAQRKVREQEMIVLIKQNEQAILKEIDERQNTGDTRIKSELIRRSRKIKELKKKNETSHYQFIAASMIENMPLPQWKPFIPALIQDWAMLQLACSTYIKPNPKNKLYVQVDYNEVSGSLKCLPHEQETLNMK